MNNKTLIFISNTDLYNNKGASYARMLCYAKALSSVNTEIVLTSKRNSINKSTKPENTQYLNIKFFGIPKLRMRKMINDVYLENIYFIAYFIYIRKVYKYFKNQKEKYSFLLYPGNLALVFVTLFYLKLIKREKVFLEKNELMLGIAWNMPVQLFSIKVLLLILIKVFLIFVFVLQDILTPLFTGIIVISTEMEKLYRPFNKNIIRIPILVEKTAVSNKEKNNKEFSIGYLGEINESKEGVISLIKVLIKLKEQYDFRLYFWGKIGVKKNIRELYKNIKASNLSERIVSHDFLRPEDIEKEISKMDLMVLPRPLNLQTKFGFSTKLSTYLMSGTPVLVTAVSDNSLYIKDGKNGFIIKKNENNLLYNKLVEIITCPKQKLLIIGSEGKKLAETHFDYMKYANVLSKFFFE